MYDGIRFLYRHTRELKHTVAVVEKMEDRGGTPTK